MAAQHLTALSSPEFPQALDRSLNQLFERVDRILAQSYLSECDFEDQYGDCRQRATVHHLESEKEYCCDHFRKVVQRG
jgi:hypothetical protein